VSPRARIYTLVGAIAAAAAVLVVALTALTADHPPKPLGPRPGKPPFAADWTAPTRLSDDVRAAVGSVPRLRGLANRNPRSSFVRLNLGLALFWRRENAAALTAWRQAKRLQPDTPSAVRAGDLLHPDSPRGLPQYQPSFTRADTRVRRLIIRGVRLQAIGRPLSAERLFARAAALAPRDADAQVAAAVGLYDKDDPSRAFGRLGPLVRRFPHAQTVRFHLGLLSIWLGAFVQARRELARTIAANAKSSYGREARLLFKRLENVRTN
jgi:tetratricopeptide (TPR) repeat protein